MTRVTQDTSLALGEGSPNARVRQVAALVLADVAPEDTNTQGNRIGERF